MTRGMTAQQLMLLLPADAGERLDAITQLLNAASFAAVVLPQLDDERSIEALAKALVPVIQKCGAAALLTAPADARLVARVGADGAQYPIDAAHLADAIDTLKPARIVGISGIKTRHDAMRAGELDVDYLLFGEPKRDGYVQDAAKTAEKAQWWAEIFNVPCVAYVSGVEETARMVDTKADFLALGPWLLSDDPSAQVRAVTDHMRASPAETDK